MPTSIRLRPAPPTKTSLTPKTAQMPGALDAAASTASRPRIRDEGGDMPFVAPKKHEHNTVGARQGGRSSERIGQCMAFHGRQKGIAPDFLVTILVYGLILGASMVVKRELSPLGPDDVRRIREKLGLSQVEAGELLGGGPRAFTKYEGGKVTPASSVMSLLHMLDANPGALAALTGQKLSPIEAEGSRPFEVTGQHVAALSERKLISLLRRLLTAEPQSEALPLDRTHLASVLTAPDGGV